MRERWTRPAFALRWLLVSALLVLGRDAGAQVSPGPLASAHRTLDTPTLCFKCHARGGGMTQRCLDCHTQIAALRSAGRGLHGREGRNQECASCHPDHAGADFSLIHWDEGSPERFDHARTGYALDGKHATVRCASCHQAKFQRGLFPTATPDPAKHWVGLDRNCRSCHDDPHRSSFGNECSKCHSTQNWKTIERRRFDHDLTRYPLRGAHAGVRCESCHVPGAANEKRPPSSTCGSCHSDAHAGQARLAGQAADCAACHDVSGFRNSTYTVAQHQKSAYPLAGRHAALACAACHTRAATGTAAAGLGTSRVRMRPPHDRCSSCHADAHGGQLADRNDGGACESCHREHGFRPSTFLLAAHDATSFPLAGRHAEIRCRSCHAAARPGLPAMASARTAGSAGFVFHPPERKCEQCHHDPHGGRFSAGGERARPAGCLECHDVATFRPARIDARQHRSFGFALDGAHGAVPCAACHAELDARPAVSSLVAAESHPRPLAFQGNRKECVACHRDPHGGQFASREDRGACQHCHGLSAFRPADRFDHNRDTAFKLDGAHARAACERCHPPGPGRTGAQYHGISRRCESCHGGDPARDQGGAKSTIGDAIRPPSSAQAMLITVHEVHHAQAR